MANETAAMPDNLVAKAQERGWPLDLVQQALSAGATPDQLISYMDRGITAEQASERLTQMTPQAGPDTAAAPSHELIAKAEEVGWPMELVQQALSMGASEADLINYMNMGVTAQEAAQYMMQQGGQQQQVDLSWMNVPTEWGTRGRPTKHGLTLEAINIGKYGDVPDTWPYQTEMPRGAVPIPGVEGMGYSIFEKQEVWSDACAPLYEEAIQRRWRPATDVPWDSIEPLPEDLERAAGQICTYFSEKAQMEADVLGRWEPEISYGYHEVKLYLATVIFEDARAVEVFRKRALSNGGGLGVQAPGWSFRCAVDARNFTEMVAIQMCLQDSLTLSEYAFGEMYAKNPAEKFIFARSLQDKARHLTYAFSHLKYALLHRPDRREELQRYFDKGEGIQGIEDRKDDATKAAFAIYFGGGKENMAAGLEVYAAMRRHFVTRYLERLKWATIDRAERMSSGMRAAIGG